jgi:membrane protein DedA with SNARE-associated domain
MFHELIRVWFGWVESWGYWGVFALMAMESTIIPVPSEIVMPPAAYWAAQGKMTLEGVILAGTLGSYVGSAINYWVSQWIGLPVLNRYGKYFLVSPEKLQLGHQWVERYGSVGIFASRLLPVVRHLISIPAGILKMPFGRFSLATVIGSGIWCAVLSWFGKEVIGGSPELLESPEALSRVIKAKLLWFVAAVVAFCALYVLMTAMKKRSARVGQAI